MLFFSQLCIAFLRLKRTLSVLFLFICQANFQRVPSFDLIFKMSWAFNASRSSLCSDPAGKYWLLTSSHLGGIKCRKCWLEVHSNRMSLAKVQFEGSFEVSILCPMNTPSLCTGMRRCPSVLFLAKGTPSPQTMCFPVSPTYSK